MEDKLLEELGFSTRTTNRLKAAKIDYLSQVLNLKKNDLYRIRGMGQKSANEVLNYIKRFKKSKRGIWDSFQTVNNVVISDAFPEIDWEQKTEILFKNKYGFYTEDVNLSEYQLSPRLVNSLAKYGIKTISEIAFMRIKDLKLIRNLGNTTYDEIIRLLKEVVSVDEKNLLANRTVNDIYGIIKKRCENENKEYKIDFFETVIKQVIKNQKIDFEYKTINELEKYIEDKKVIGTAFYDDAFMNYLCNYVYSIISKEMTPISKRNIELVFPTLFEEYDVIAKCIRSLINDKKIIHVKGGYIKRLPTVYEWMETLPETKKDIIALRLSGKTLEECGKEFGITRERVRQIVSKSLSNKPLLKEDLLSYWFKEYDLTLDQFCSIFNGKENEFYYLNQVYKKGSRKIDEIEEDPNATRYILSNLDNELRKTRVYINGKYLPNKRIEVVGEFGRNICSEESISLDDFYQEYNRLLRQIGREEDSELIYPNKRAFESSVSLSQNYLLQYGRKVRFYPLAEYDIEDFLERLNLEEYKNVELSTLKIYRNNQELMDEYDIQNEYELHNLLKKTLKIWNKNDRRNVDFSRMPLIVFGRASRQKQTVDLLYRIAPVTIEEFGKAYEEEYGVLSQTVMANMYQYIADYCHAGVFSVNQEPLESEEKKYLLMYLKNDFYFIDDVIKDFEKVFGKDKTAHVNPRTIQELGYKVFAKCIVNKKYNSLEDYFMELLSNEEIIDLNSFDQRIMYNQSFCRVLNNYRNNFNLLEFEEKKYISFNRFHRVLKIYSKEELLDYVESAIKYSGNKEYFTINSLRKDGFSHQLQDVALNDWFFSSLIKNSKLIKTIEYGKNRVFYKTNSKKTAANFIESIMKDALTMDIDKLIELLQVEYGITAHKERLIGIVRSTGMYYDNTMNKIYVDKSYYYDDLR